MPIIEVPGKGNVEFPDTMDHGQIVVAIQNMVGPAKPPGVLAPGLNPSALMAANAPAPDTNRMGRILASARAAGPSDATKLALATPGGPALGLFRNMGVQGGAQEAGSLARGEGPTEAAKKNITGVLGAAGGVGVEKGIKAVANSGPLQRFTDLAEQKIVDYLKQRVPAWANLNSLKDMFTGQGGHDALHIMYDNALKGAVKEGTGIPVQLSEKSARALGLPTVARVGTGKEGADLSTAVVDAGELTKAMLGQWRKNPEAFREAADVLETAGKGVAPDIRNAYKTAMGLRESLGKATDKSGKFDVMRAQQAVGQVGRPNDALLGRGLQEDMANIVNPGGGPLITQGNYKLPGALIGGGLGALGLGHVLPGLGHVGGAGGGAYMGSKIGGMIPKYGNVPATPLGPLGATAVQMSPLSRALIQSAAQEAVSS